MALVVKNLPANAGDTGDAGLTLGQEDPLEKSMAVHFNILAWRIPRTEEPGGLQSMGSQKSQRLNSNKMVRTYLSEMMRLCNKTWQELPAPSIQDKFC